MNGANDGVAVGVIVGLAVRSVVGAVGGPTVVLMRMGVVEPVVRIAAVGISVVGGDEAGAMV